MLEYYTPSDGEAFKFRDEEEIKNILLRCPDFLKELKGEVYTIWSEGEAVAIVGIDVSIYGNASLFMSSSKSLKEKFNKEIMSDFKSIVDHAKLHCKRVECIVAENSVNKRFVEFLGFHEECKLKKYGFDGEDMYLYVYIG